MSIFKLLKIRYNFSSVQITKKNCESVLKMILLSFQIVKVYLVVLILKCNTYYKHKQKTICRTSYWLYDHYFGYFNISFSIVHYKLSFYTWTSHNKNQNTIMIGGQTVTHL